MTADTPLILGTAEQPLLLDDHLELLEGIKKLLLTQQFTVITVHPLPDDQHQRHLAYSVGLARYGLPELVGLGALTANSIGVAIDRVAQCWLKAKQARMGRYPKIFVTEDERVMPLYIQYVNAEALNPDLMQLTAGYYGTMPSVAQLLWPDPNGCLPIEDDYLTVDYPQPVLPIYTPPHRPVN